MRSLLAANPGEPVFGPWYILSAGALVGTCGFKGPPDDQGSVEIGYAVIPPAQGRGIGRAAIALLLRLAFADPRVREVMAQTLPELVTSQAVLRHCGFTMVGQPTSERGKPLRFACQRPG